jgi:hypothetical protein
MANSLYHICLGKVLVLLPAIYSQKTIPNSSKQKGKKNVSHMTADDQVLTYVLSSECSNTCMTDILNDICICMHILLYTWKKTCTYVLVWESRYIDMHIYTHMHIHIYVYIYIYLCMYIYIYIYTYMCMYLSTYLYSYICIYV